MLAGKKCDVTELHIFLFCAGRKMQTSSHRCGYVQSVAVLLILTQIAVDKFNLQDRNTLNNLETLAGT